jgi:exopolysaccharide biosynthesis polyprenyl glycosylphosphotransferase
MAPLLALVEGMLVFATAVAGNVLWSQPVVFDWLDAAALIGQAVTVSISCLVAFYYNDFYDLRVVSTFSDFALRLLQSLGVAVILLAACYYFVPDVRMPRASLLASLATVLGVIVPLRAGFYASLRRRPFVERILVLGTSTLARALMHEMAVAHGRYVIVAIADDGGSSALDASERRRPPVPVFGPLSRLEKIIDEVRPDRVVVTLAERRGRLPVDVLLEARARGIAVEDGVELYERLSGKIAIEALTPSNLIFSRDFKKSRLDLLTGRAMSLAVGLAGLLVLAPVLGLIALAIALDSRGSVFFVHERVGLHCRPFKLIKFRTMHPMAGPTSEWARDNHHRVTRVGKWLRKFRLDELPQFVNMLRGDLNLIGPRPHPVSNYELFLREIPYYSLRSIVRPGVTGWAQVRYGYANNLAEETEKMRYDLYFIKHLGLGLELRILFDTIKTVLFGRGAQEAETDHGLAQRGLDKGVAS